MTRLDLNNWQLSVLLKPDLQIEACCTQLWSRPSLALARWRCCWPLRDPVRKQGKAWFLHKNTCNRIKAKARSVTLMKPKLQTECIKCECLSKKGTFDQIWAFKACLAPSYTAKHPVLQDHKCCTSARNLSYTRVHVLLRKLKEK